MLKEPSMLNLEVVRFIVRAFILGYLLGALGWMACLVLGGLVYGASLLSSDDRRRRLGEGVAFLINGAHRRLSGQECPTPAPAQAAPILRPEPVNPSARVPLSFLVPVVPPRPELVDPAAVYQVLTRLLQGFVYLEAAEDWLARRGMLLSRLHDLYQDMAS